jgi:glycosidase
VEFNNDLFNHYKKLVTIRNNHAALRMGDFKTLIADNINFIYTFERISDNEKVIVILNNGNEPKDVVIPVKGKFADLLNDNELFSSNNELRIKVPGKWGRILLVQE